MDDKPFFALSTYHSGRALIGAGIIGAFWLPRFLSGREPAASALLILFAIAIYSILPDVATGLAPRAAPKFWELASELAVIIALFGTGARCGLFISGAPSRITLRIRATLCATLIP